MLKWLVITIVVLAGFMAILLGLGYLLNENEKSTTALKAQLEQESLREKARQASREQRTSIAAYPSPAPKTKMSPQVFNVAENMRVIEQFEKIVVGNLTCVSTSQCQIVTVDFKNNQCRVAINNIGASLLRNLNSKNSIISSCPDAAELSMLQCQQNLCTLGN